MAGNYIVSKIRMRDIHVYLFETVVMFNLKELNIIRVNFGPHTSIILVSIIKYHYFVYF